MNKDQISKKFEELQYFICKELERIDGKSTFSSDKWLRPEGGGGQTKVLTNGEIIDKGGVAFSSVYGTVSEQMKEALQVNGTDFYATGVSIVIHPKSPHIPIIHMNVRYFEYDKGTRYWFGGGIDLTPHYVINEQAYEFHKSLKIICDKYNPEFYELFRKKADDYFFLPHRNETRGIGGIFYDHLCENNYLSKQQLVNFSVELGEIFPFLYEYQVNLGRNISILPQHIDWMNLRRGRYVEFNLLYDRGTKFGLHSGGRTESILMSLPKNANWEYMHTVEKGSPEQETLNYLKKGKFSAS